MRKNKVLSCLLCLVTSAVVLSSAEARAEEADTPRYRVTLFYSPATTTLKAPTLAGGVPSFENEGDYFGLNAEATYGKISLYGFFQDGTSDTITGGADFTAPTFNAITHEHSTQTELNVGYSVLQNPYTGTVDLTLGYYRLWAKPAISPANWYDGPEVGVRGRRAFESKLALVYKFSYLPIYSVHGWMDGKMRDDHGNIMLYKVGLEYPIARNVSVTAGYQKARLQAEVIKDESSAVVTLSGFYYGVVVCF
jgi:hypothetical protein